MNDKEWRDMIDREEKEWRLKVEEEDRKHQRKLFLIVGSIPFVALLAGLVVGFLLRKLS